MPRQSRLAAPGTLHHVVVLAGMGPGKDCLDFESRVWDCDSGDSEAVRGLHLGNRRGNSEKGGRGLKESLFKKVPRWPFNIGPKRWLLRSPFYGKGVLPWYSGWFCGARITSGHWPFS